MKQNTEVILCKAFIELLKKYSFSKITIQMIAAQCGVNRQTFYYHFDNIYDLLGHAFEYEMIQESNLVTEQSWDHSLKQFLLWMKKNRVIIKNLISNVDGFYMRNAIYPVIVKCMSNAYIPNVIIHDLGSSVEEEFVQKFLTLGITQYVLEWAMSDYKEPEDDVIDNIFLILKRMYRLES